MSKLFYCADEDVGVWFNLNEVKKIEIENFSSELMETWLVNFTLDDGSKYNTAPIFSDPDEAFNYVRSLLESNNLLAKQ